MQAFPLSHLKPCQFDNLRGPADYQIGMVLNGLRGMPAFKMLSDTYIASVITYERRSFGNNGSVVQPSDVTSAR